MKFVYLLAIFILSTIITDAQRAFSEGLIKYDIYIDGNKDATGIYIVTVKNGFVKREIAMHNGFNNITIYNQKSGTSTSLSDKENSKYALVLSAEELKEKNKKFENASFESLDSKKKVAGYNCVGTKVTYTNGETANFYYTSELLPQFDLFYIMFPGLKGIPLEYEIKQGKSIMLLKASLIETKAIDSQIFNIPSDFKLVTKKELESLR